MTNENHSNWANNRAESQKKVKKRINSGPKSSANVNHKKPVHNHPKIKKTPLSSVDDPKKKKRFVYNHSKHLHNRPKQGQKPSVKTKRKKERYRDRTINSDTDQAQDSSIPQKSKGRMPEWVKQKRK